MSTHYKCRWAHLSVKLYIFCAKLESDGSKRRVHTDKQTDGWTVQSAISPCITVYNEHNWTQTLLSSWLIINLTLKIPQSISVRRFFPVSGKKKPLEKNLG